MGELTDKAKKFLLDYLMVDAAQAARDPASLLQAIKLVQVPEGATEAERKYIADRLGSARSLLDAGSTAPELRAAQTEIDSAKQRVGEVQARLDREREETKQRRQKIDEILTEARKRALTLDPDASGHAETVQKFVDDMVGHLAKAADPVMLTQAQEAAKALDATLTKATEAGETVRGERRLRRASLLKLIDSAKPHAEATETEKIELVNRGKPIRDLPETPAASAFDGLDTLAKEIGEAAEKLTQAVTERKQRFGRAADLLARLREDAAALKPHARAPAAQSGTIVTDITKLRQESSRFADWAQVTAWQASDLDTLDDKVKQLETRTKELGEAVDKQIQDVEAAVTKAKSAVTAAKGRKFVSAQETALLNAIDLEAGRFTADFSVGASVIVALAKYETEAGALSQALATLQKRYDAVTSPADAKLSPEEKKRLVAAKLAAAKALDEVTEP